MACRGMVHIGNMHYVSATEAQIDVNYVGFSATPGVEAAFNILVAQDSPLPLIAAAVAQAVKNRLVDEWGFVIAPQDTVRLFGIDPVEI